ncbi:hypothetical protein F5J12DRAFT_890821 [Pisolithus orientalis]|uniref:uncharacterized protein n=1 Tax=Pisolithus orientalis TaxID=936130 RepID=UPI00222431C2|nr:uncharacterized protein F5J12DRAFT_890821 [Pisolithus orientalis]KAI6012472.1 hypothetical protein F5J12DRAFT_890821 [Pisolithus orientalis]
MSEKLQEVLEIPQEFVRDGNQFLTRCTKPSRKEFLQISRAVAIGFAVMGFIGYFVKLIHIPINNILVYVKNHTMTYCNPADELFLVVGLSHHRVLYYLSEALLFYDPPYSIGDRSGAELYTSTAQEC